MIGARFHRAMSPARLATLALSPLAAIAAWATIALSGTRFGTALAIGAVLGPLALYAMLAAPLIVPFAVFAMSIPFENLLAFASFGTMTKALGALSGLAIGFRLLRTRRYVAPDRAVAAWIPFVALALASFTWARDPGRGVLEAGTIAELFLLYAIVAYMPVDRRTLWYVLGAVVLGADLAGAYGAYLFHRGIDVAAGRLIVGSGGEGSIIDPNHFAAALLVPVVLALVGLVEARARSLRIVAFATLFIAGVGIAVSGSRGAILAFGAAFLYAVIRSRKRMLLLAIAVAAVGLGLVEFGSIVDRFNEAAATGGAGRLGIWRVALAAFGSHPLLGSGVGNFALAYNDAYLSVPAFAQMKIVEGARWSIAPHNDLVWIGVELGALGLAAFLFAFWQQFRALRDVDREGEFGWLRLALEAGLIAQFVAGLFLGTLTYKYLWLCFMLAAIVRNASIGARRRTP
ncbi:MAG: O-antigen ligase family protein [bacterium]|nr:O-antigen ligase family protein [bacterium]